MLPSQDYSLQELPKGYPLAEYHRRLMRNGAPLRVVLKGDTVAFQMACGGMTLIATSYDYFDGCSHWVYLLDAQGQPRDLVRLQDTFGFIQAVDVVSPTQVAFAVDDIRRKWAVEIQVVECGFWSYSLRHLAHRPHRFLLSKRHLVVSTQVSATPVQAD